MRLQFVGVTCKPYQAVNPETGQCFNVCPEDQVYDPQDGCGDANWFVRNKYFVAFVGALAVAGWWRYFR